MFFSGSALSDGKDHDIFFPAFHQFDIFRINGSHIGSRIDFCRKRSLERFDRDRFFNADHSQRQSAKRIFLATGTQQRHSHGG